jgi:DHA3 family macrolide efflux protein-like MFS transporter
MGDRLAWVAFPWLVYQATGSTLGTGAVFALYTLPYLFFGAAAGVLVDRFNRRRVMVAMDVLRACLALLVPLVAGWSLPLVYVLSFAIATCGVLFEPARLAIVPELVPVGRLLRANSLLATTENLTEILGFALGGVLVAVLSTAAAFRLDAASFALSAVCLFLIRYQAPARAAAEHTARAFFSELHEGLSFLRHHRGLLLNTAMILASIVGAGASAPLGFFLAVRVFGLDTSAFGALEASMGVGFLVGSLLLAALATRARKGWIMIAGLIAMGLFLALVALTHTVWQACIPYALFGVANAAAIIAVDTYLQETVPERLRGRVMGARMTLTQGTYALAVLVSGALAGIVDIRILFVASGALIAIPALAGMFVRDIREV